MYEAGQGHVKRGERRGRRYIVLYCVYILVYLYNPSQANERKKERKKILELTYDGFCFFICIFIFHELTMLICTCLC